MTPSGDHVEGNTSLRRQVKIRYHVKSFQATGKSCRSNVEPSLAANSKSAWCRCFLLNRCDFVVLLVFVFVQSY